MTKFQDPRKMAELQEVAKKYNEYKGLKNLKKAEHDILIAQEMEFEREQFSNYLQSKIDRQGYPYKISVADLMRAMGTTHRPTVIGFVKDARQRAEETRLNNFLNAPLPLEIISYENTAQVEHDAHAHAIMDVLVDGSGYRLIYLTGDGGGRTLRYQEYDYTTDGEAITFTTTKGKIFRRLLPLGSDDADKGAVPDWLEYAVSTPEWKSIAPNFGD